eukprot:6207299-Pleurochrysis_carterae.AAC.2
MEGKGSSERDRKQGLLGGARQSAGSQKSRTQVGLSEKASGVTARARACAVSCHRMSEICEKETVSVRSVVVSLIGSSWSLKVHMSLNATRRCKQVEWWMPHGHCRRTRRTHDHRSAQQRTAVDWRARRGGRGARGS